MAIVVDAARPADEPVGRAAAAFTQPTADIAYDQVFTIEQSVVDDRVPTMVTDGDITPPTPTAQSAMPITKFDAFFLDGVSATERFT